MRISDWSSDVCSSDLLIILAKSSGDTWPTKSPLCQIAKATACQCRTPLFMKAGRSSASETPNRNRNSGLKKSGRSEEHTSELQSLMRISYAVFCLKKKKNKQEEAKRRRVQITNHTL